MSSITLATSRELYGRVISIGDDQRRVVGARKQLVVRADLVCLMRAVEIALGLVHIGGRDRIADILQIQAVGGQGRGISLNPHRRLLPSADAHQSHARQLRDFRREPRIGQVLHLRKGSVVRGQRQRQNRRVGGITLRRSAAWEDRPAGRFPMR